MASDRTNWPHRARRTERILERPPKPACSRCWHRGFWRQTATDGRPEFVCDSCGHTWTSGADGSPYAGHEMGTRDAS